jgi:diguanylate cyclase (GGDEF)-like protein
MLLRTLGEGRSMPALHLLTLLSLTIFGGEIAIMFALDYANIENEFLKNAADAAALVVVVFPFLYFFIFRTIMKKNKDLIAFQQQLLVAQEELEQRIEERTTEITIANRELKQMVERLNIRRSEIVRLGEMVNFFQACNNLDEALSVAQSQLQSLFSGLSGVLFLMKASRNFLERAISWGQVIDMEPCYAPDDCWALRRGKPHATGGANGITPCRHLHTAGAYRYICLPLLAHGETLGTLCLQVSEADAGGYDDGDRRSGDRTTFYIAVAESLALAISNLRLRESLRNQAIRDQLTGLFNRRYLLETLERELHRAAARDQCLTVAMVDIDHFKQFNDTFGHAAGDAVLAKLGIAMREWRRGEDVVARYGGEEFAIVFPDLPAELAFERLESLRQTIGSITIDYHGQLLPPLTISAGMAAYPMHAVDQEGLINIADQALYSSKEGGRNRVTVASDTAGLARILKNEDQSISDPAYVRTA